MTLVNTETGEIVDFDKAAAERRAERITLRLESIADNYNAVLPMIRESIEKRDDMALGYRSPGDYVADRFGQALSGLGIDVRRAVVGELTQAGLSTRAIAPVVGASFKTVARDIAAPVSGDTPQTPEPAARGEAVTGSGQTPGGEVTPATPPSATATPRSPVTGIDGKTYPAPTPKPTPSPVLTGVDAEYANAEKACNALNRAIRKLLEFQHPNMRSGMARYWSMASSEVPPAQRADVTPEQMRAAAHGLLALADEWNPR